MHSRYVLSAAAFRSIVIALILSSLLNGSAIFLWYLGRAGHDDRHVSTFSRLPLRLHRVALRVVESTRYGLEDDDDWASTIPPGHGFVRLDDGEFYAVSMYHQMHCLNSFRKIFNGHRNASRAKHDEAHALHCLSYLRQMVLCGADITLEPASAAQNVDGRTTQAVYGAGVTHQCYDWVQVRDFMEANYEAWRADDHYAASEVNVGSRRA
ncbi:hypothetical protein GY45DRAFT_662877 [Cubamyces sp. BRFM 1775]|nr:hypothetical protein GY45DRAFT_662877 [Cubamyces sp. BRFM 1775]